MELILYTCTGNNGNCGFVSTVNFRDDCCPVCKTCGKINRITLWAPDLSDFKVIVEPAPYTEEES